MKFETKKLGSLIKEVKEKNKDGLYDEVLGISIEKEFMPSVANIIGTDLKKYYVIRKNRFAFNPMHVGRDEKLPISLYKRDEPALVSPAYTMFEIKDLTEVEPEYLMFIFKTDIFDRLCWFTTDSSVRGGLNWEDFINIDIKLPSKQEQLKILKKINGLNNRINLLQDINQNIIELMQKYLEKNIFSVLGINTLDEVENVLLPENWELRNLSQVADCQSGYAFYKDGYSEEGTRIIDLGNINIYSEVLKYDTDKRVNNNKYNSSKYDKFRLKKNDLIMVMTDRKATMELLGKTGKILDDEEMLLNQRVYRVRSKINENFLYVYLNSEIVHIYHMSESSGTAQKYVNNIDIDNVPVIIPDEFTYKKLCEVFDKFMEQFELNVREIEKINDIYMKYKESI